MILGWPLYRVDSFADEIGLIGWLSVHKGNGGLTGESDLVLDIGF